MSQVSDLDRGVWLENKSWSCVCVVGKKDTMRCCAKTACNAIFVLALALCSVCNVRIAIVECQIFYKVHFQYTTCIRLLSYEIEEIK